MLIVRFFLLFFLLFLLSCNGKDNQENNRKVLKHSKESLEEINKSLIEKDDHLIRSYVNRRGWNMKKSETGLWYMIIEKGDESKVVEGDIVKYNYKLRLFDGTLCYSSDDLGPKTIIVGQGGVESGLEEGLLLMSKGSKGRFILPPHLAHGLIGDENKIPARAIIIYDIEILDANNQN